MIVSDVDIVLIITVMTLVLHFPCRDPPVTVVSLDKTVWLVPRWASVLLLLQEQRKRKWTWMILDATDLAENDKEIHAADASIVTRVNLWKWQLTYSICCLLHLEIAVNNDLLQYSLWVYNCFWLLLPWENNIPKSPNHNVVWYSHTTSPQTGFTFSQFVSVTFKYNHGTVVYCSVIRSYKHVWQCKSLLKWKSWNYSAVALSETVSTLWPVWVLPLSQTKSTFTQL